MPQGLLAAKVGISNSYLSQLEGDKREATIPLLRRLAKELGAPAALLFAAALSDDGSARQKNQISEVLERLTDAVSASLTLKTPPSRSKRANN